MLAFLIKSYPLIATCFLVQKARGGKMAPATAVSQIRAGLSAILTPHDERVKLSRIDDEREQRLKRNENDAYISGNSVTC